MGAVTDVSLTVEPGQLVAVTGRGGAGKSTLIGLVARTIDPDAGSITIDSQLLALTTLRSTARWVGAAGPDLPLMRGTVQRNLTYGVPDATADEVRRVIAATGLDEMLAELPDGILTWVTEGGRNLSVSQRQRIALARALMGNPPILLLDEPTDGLDQESKAAFRRTLSRHRGTVLFVSHDPSEIALADTVVVLADGRVESQLSGEEYRDQLWRATQKGTQWSPTASS